MYGNDYEEDWTEDLSGFREDHSAGDYEAQRLVEELATKVANGTIKPLNDTAFMTQKEGFHHLFQVMGSALNAVDEQIAGEMRAQERHEMVNLMAKLRIDFQELTNYTMRSFKR